MSILSKMGELFTDISKGMFQVSSKGARHIDTDNSSALNTPISTSSIATSSHSSEGEKTETFERTSKSIQSISESSIMTDNVNNYTNMTDAAKIASLEKAVRDQGVYLKAMQESMKVLNRRNTLAVIELQILVRDCELKHPDLQAIINPVMVKVSEILDFKKPYEV